MVIYYITNKIKNVITQNKYCQRKDSKLIE